MLQNTEYFKSLNSRPLIPIFFLRIKKILLELNISFKNGRIKQTMITHIIVWYINFIENQKQ